VATGVLPTLRQDDASLVETARAIGGGPAAWVLRITAVVSMLGFCSGSALVGPQLVASLSDDGVLPGVLGRRTGERGTHRPAIGLFIGAAAIAVVVLGFKSLADLTIITLFAQYVPTCLAVIIFRRWRPEAQRQFRIPLGVTVPMLALLFMGFLITRIDLGALATTMVILGVGVALCAVMGVVHARRRASAPPVAEPSVPKAV